MLNVLMLNLTNKAFMRNVVTLNVIMLSVNMLNVMASYLKLGRKKLARNLENTHQALISF